MAEITSVPRSDLNITALPIELQLETVSYLTFLEKQLLRSSNHHFRALLPEPTKDDFHEAQDTADVIIRRLLYCNGCNRFLRPDRFSTKMRRTNAKGPKGGKYSRFCIECGCRPQNGTAEDLFKYHRAHRWEHEGVAYVKCRRCNLGTTAAPAVPYGDNAWRSWYCLTCIPMEMRFREEVAERKRLEQIEWEAGAEERRLQLSLKREADERDLTEMYQRERQQDESQAHKGEEPLQRRRLIFIPGCVRVSWRWIETMGQGASPQP